MQLQNIRILLQKLFEPHFTPECVPEKRICLECDIKNFALTLRRLNLKFIYSEKATKFLEIFKRPPWCTVVKSKVKMSQNFVAFSEYMNFNSNAQHEILMILFFDHVGMSRNTSKDP